MFNQRLPWILLLLAAGILGGAWTFVSREPVTDTTAAEGLAEAAQAGFLAPDFTLQSYLGQEVTLSDHFGQPIVINFWATWCPPCRAEVPHLQNASEKYNGRITLLGVDQGEPAGEIARFAGEFGLTFPLLVDQTNRVNMSYGIRALPTTIFVDRNGVVREVFSGILNQAILEDRINKLLAEG